MQFDVLCLDLASDKKLNLSFLQRPLRIRAPAALSGYVHVFCWDIPMQYQR